MSVKSKIDLDNIVDLDIKLWLLDGYLATLATRSQHTRDAYRRDIYQFVEYLSRGLSKEPKDIERMLRGFQYKIISQVQLLGKLQQ